MSVSGCALGTTSPTIASRSWQPQRIHNPKKRADQVLMSTRVSRRREQIAYAIRGLGVARPREIALEPGPSA
jgi:hypothetical protein